MWSDVRAMFEQRTGIVSVALARSDRERALPYRVSLSPSFDAQQATNARLTGRAPGTTLSYGARRAMAGPKVPTRPEIGVQVVHCGGVASTFPAIMLVPLRSRLCETSMAGDSGASPAVVRSSVRRDPSCVWLPSHIALQCSQTAPRGRRQGIPPSGCPIHHRTLDQRQSSARSTKPPEAGECHDRS